MNPHNYHRSSEYEKTWHSLANDFYFSKYPNCSLRRYLLNTAEHIEFQKSDIDISIIQNEKIVHISEKFRQVDYGDLLLEIYSKYPDTKGWMDNSRADYLAYFSPKKVYIIKKEAIVAWYQLQGFENTLAQEIESLHRGHLNHSCKMKLAYKTMAGNEIQLTIIQAYNQTKSSDWYTLSLAVSWEDLKRERVQFKEFLLN